MVILLSIFKLCYPLSCGHILINLQALLSIARWSRCYPSLSFGIHYQVVMLLSIFKQALLSVVRWSLCYSSLSFVIHWQVVTLLSISKQALLSVVRWSLCYSSLSFVIRCQVVCRRHQVPRVVRSPPLQWSINIQIWFLSCKHDLYFN